MFLDENGVKELKASLIRHEEFSDFFKYTLEEKLELLKEIISEDYIATYDESEVGTDDQFKSLDGIIELLTTIDPAKFTDIQAKIKLISKQLGDLAEEASAEGLKLKDLDVDYDLSKCVDSMGWSSSSLDC